MIRWRAAGEKLLEKSVCHTQPVHMRGNKHKKQGRGTKKKPIGPPHPKIFGGFHYSMIKTSRLLWILAGAELWSHFVIVTGKSNHKGVSRLLSAFETT